MRERIKGEKKGNGLFFFGNVKKGFALADDLFEELIWDADVFKIQKPDFHEGMAQLGEELRFRRWV